MSMSIYPNVHLTKRPYTQTSSYIPSRLQKAQVTKRPFYQMYRLPERPDYKTL